MDQLQDIETNNQRFATLDLSKSYSVVITTSRWSSLMNDSPHQPVLYKEIIHALQPRRGGRYVDGTLGAGGHARGIMEASAPDGQLLGLDVDPQALRARS